MSRSLKPRPALAGKTFVQTPFAAALTRRACAWRRRWDGSGHPIFASWIDGIYPDFRAVAEDAVRVDEVRLHDYAAAVTSSQAFALNLFLPFRDGPRDSLADALAPLLGERVAIERVAFEWVPPGALLGEIDGDRPRSGEPATGVDAVLWARRPSGGRCGVLLEVKLGEGGFTPCGGRDSAGNQRPDVCASAATFLAETQSCYLRRPVRKRRDRRYWTIFAEAHGSVANAFPGVDLEGPCPFAGQAQQPMRNLALARALEQEGSVERAWFGLCAHDENPDVAAHWAGWRGLLRDPGEAPVLTASAVIAAGRAAGHGGWADWMEARYWLGRMSDEGRP